MDSYHEHLKTEINDELDDLAKQEKPWIARWVAHTICEEHSNGLRKNTESDFWRWTGYRHVRKMVTEQINRRASLKAVDDAATNGQLILNGFEREYLQDYYVVDRIDEYGERGEGIGIAVTNLSDDELDAIASVKRSMGSACFAHADEIDRFKMWRRRAKQA